MADSEEQEEGKEEVSEVTTVTPTKSEYYLDDVIISGIEESLGIEVPFDMKLRYKEAGEPSQMASHKTGPKMVRLKNAVPRTFNFHYIHVIDKKSEIC